MLWHTTSQFKPPIDVIELSDRIVILVEVAGMRADDFRISLNGDEVTISGVRHRPIFESTAHHRVEIGYGEFRLKIPLPWSIHSDKVSANYQDGFLRLDLPRRAEKKIRIVDIENRQDTTPDDE
jgi:HSP20 family protein